MNIAFFEVEPEEKKQIQASLQGHTIQFFEHSLKEKDIPHLQETQVLSTFVFSPFPETILEQLPNLKLISTRSTGYDHINLDYCREKNITVCNVPTYGENTVAEHAFALMINLARKIYPAIKRTHEEKTFTTDKTLRGIDLNKKTLGIIGCGNIGKHLIKMAKGFDMNVLVFDLHQNAQLAAQLGFHYTSLENLYHQSDFISLHVPYNKHTHHLINAAALAQMKPTSYIINTSRGAVIDTQALLEALKEGSIAGAGLDVLEGEQDIKEEQQVLSKQHKNIQLNKTLLADKALMELDNVIITPHNAFNSVEAQQRILQTTLENINAFIQGSSQNNIN